MLIIMKILPQIAQSSHPTNNYRVLREGEVQEGMQPKVPEYPLLPKVP